MESVSGLRDKVLTIGLVVLVIGVTVFLGIQYLRITADNVFGTSCVQISEADAESLALEFVTRRRSDQRLHIDYDLRELVGGPQLDCATVLGESRCSISGPTYLSGSLRRSQVIYQVPKGKTVIVRANDGEILCVIPEA